MVLVVLPLGVSAQGNLVFNGGFDTDASGWMLVDMSMGGGFETTKGNPPGDVVLASFPSPDTDPTASQTINSLTPVAIYTVSGDFRYIQDRGGGLPTDMGFGVALDGVYLFESADRTPNIWQHFSFSYTASSASALLSLSAQRNGTGLVYAIDNLSMKIPEPSSGALLLAGVGLLVLARRRMG